jgi:hypothetical protein
MKEEIFSNCLYELIRKDSSIGQLLEGKRQFLILLPSSKILAAVGSQNYATKCFIDSHIIQSIHIPGMFVTLRGHGAELKGDRITVNGPKRVTAIVTQTESVYDLGSSLKILVIDRPLVGEYTPPPPLTASGDSVGPSEWLAGCPLIESDYFEKILRLKKSFILVPGYESLLADRIRTLSLSAARAVLNYSPTADTPVEVIADEIERAGYVTLNSTIFSHFLEYCGIVKGDPIPVTLELLEEIDSPADLRGDRKFIELIKIEIIPKFNELEKILNPVSKLETLKIILEICTRKILKIQNPSSEHFLTCMILGLAGSGGYTRAPAHAAHMEMTGRVGVDSSGFALTTYQTAYQFIHKYLARR